MTTLSILGLVVLIVAAILIALTKARIEREAQLRAWRRVAEARRELAATTESELLDAYWGREGPPGRGALMLKLAKIETKANKLLDTLLGKQARQLFDIRAELRRLDIWSDEDVAMFDRAMAVRNAVVHGGDEHHHHTGSASAKELDELLLKLDHPSGVAGRDG